MGNFGSGGLPTPRRLVGSTPKVASPPSAGLARESVTLRVGETEQTIEIVRQPRHLGGHQAYWLCPKCSALRSHLYVVQDGPRDGALLCCRVCGKLSYRSQHVLHPALIRAAKLRRKLGAAPGLLAPLPLRPCNVWAAARYDRLTRELAAAEDVIAEMLGATIKALERRKGRLHGPR